MIRKLVVMLVVGAICLGGIIPALAQQHVYSTLKEYEKITGKKIEKFNGAPMLRTKVATGELPAVEERLPEEPLVVEPFEEIGQYGGTLRICQTDLDWGACWWRAIVMEPLIIWDEHKEKYVPNVAKDWKISEDGKVFTFYLRKGMKWSDGVPFTADDMMFWYEDCLLNKDITPVQPGWANWGGEPVKVKKIDDYTVQYSFGTPFIGFFGYIDGTYSYVDTNQLYRCKHFLKQFHPRYVSEEKLEKITKEADFKYWYELFRNRDRSPDNYSQMKGKPTLVPWVITTAFSGGNLRIAERNPYYWKVDTAGNQLPYIDKMQEEIVTSTEVAVMKAIAGEIDFDGCPPSSITAVEIKMRYPLYMENREKGDYRIVKMGTTTSSEETLYLNQTYKEDLVLGELFRNKQFRIALALGIDREEISELVFNGIAEPTQGHGRPGCGWYVESVDKVNTEFDPERANKLLDEIGLDRRNAEGIRLRSDGEPVQIRIETGIKPPKIAELIADHWTKDLGIKTTVKLYDWPILYCKRDANELQMVSYWGTQDASTLPHQAYHYNFVGWGGRLWHNWLITKGKKGEEPPADVKRVYKILTEDTLKVGVAERNELLKELMRLHAENQWDFATVVVPFGPIYIKNGLRNIPEGEDIIMNWGGGGIPPIIPSQWFWKK